MKRLFLIIFCFLACVGPAAAQWARTVMADQNWYLQFRDAIVDTNLLAVRAGDIDGDTNTSTVVGFQGRSIAVPAGAAGLTVASKLNAKGPAPAVKVAAVHTTAF